MTGRATTATIDECYAMLCACIVKQAYQDTITYGIRYNVLTRKNLCDHASKVKQSAYKSARHEAISILRFKGNRNPTEEQIWKYTESVIAHRIRDAKNEMDDCRKFFYSDHYKMLTNIIDGELLWHRAKKQADLFVEGKPCDIRVGDYMKIKA